MILCLIPLVSFLKDDIGTSSIPFNDDSLSNNMGLFVKREIVFNSNDIFEDKEDLSYSIYFNGNQWRISNSRTVFPDLKNYNSGIDIGYAAKNHAGFTNAVSKFFSWSRQAVEQQIRDVRKPMLDITNCISLTFCINNGSDPFVICVQHKAAGEEQSQLSSNIISRISQVLNLATDMVDEYRKPYYEKKKASEFLK